MGTKKIKPKGYWTLEKCRIEALKYKTKKDFYSKSSGAYMVLCKNNLLNDACKHMNGKIKKPNGYWTKERCLEEALRFKTKKEFIKESNNVYSFSLTKKWMNEICNHMS